MVNFFKKLFKTADNIHDAIFSTISTSAEFDVKDRIEDEIRQAVQATIDECSKKYYRSIHFDFKVSVD